MKLKLMVKGSCWHEMEINVPKNEHLSFQENFEIKERYVELMCRRIKNKYQRLLEDLTWEIILVAESRITEVECLKIA